MVKTRSQAKNITIENEQVEVRGPTHVLKGISNITTKRNKITKRKSPAVKNNQLAAQQASLEEEEDSDNESLFDYPTRMKRQTVSQEQIEQLIDYIVNHKMNVAKASRRVSIAPDTGRRYYRIYRSDPEKKIPTPLNGSIHLQTTYTQRHIEDLIGFINNDKMTLKEAAAKAEMTYRTARTYYLRYLDDPEHNIPVPRMLQSITQEKKDKFISYIINDKMNIKEASKKANMDSTSGRHYYHAYFKNQNHGIPIPTHITTFNRYKKEQIKEAIDCIINDKMSIAAASIKVNMDPSATGKYYRQYLKDNGMELPPARNVQLTQEQIKNLISYIVDDKMTITAAAKKVNISQGTGSRYYHQYLKENNLKPPPPKYTQDRKNQLIGYIVDDKMSVRAAAQKANFPYITALRHYYQYVKDHDLDVPTEQHSQDKINEVIGYIVDDKMNITAASKKARISYSAGCRYYWQYLDDKKRDTPA